MMARVPPYPVSDAPHTDIEIRELYQRMLDVETATGIDPQAPPPPETPDLGHVYLVEGIPVKLFNGFVNYDQGWFDAGTDVVTRPPVLLGRATPPFIVLSVQITAHTLFDADADDPTSLEKFGVGTDSAVVGGDNHRLYAWSNRSFPGLEYLGQDVVLNYVQVLPGADLKGTGVLQTGGGFIYAGFIHNSYIDPNYPGQGWPPGMQGTLHVMVLYADSAAGTRTRIVDLAGRRLLSPAGPTG